MLVINSREFSDNQNKKERRKAAVDLLLSDYIHDTDLTETTVSDTDDIYELDL